MQKFLPTIIKQAAFIFDGYGYAGIQDEAKLPPLKKIIEDWRGGGMPGAVGVNMGIEKMQFTAKLAGVNEQLYRAWADYGDPVKQFSLNGHAVNEDTNQQVGVTCMMRGEVSGLEEDETKAGTIGMLSGEIEVRRIRIVVDNELVLDYDPIAIILDRGNGNELEQMRVNLGIGRS